MRCKVCGREPHEIPEYIDAVAEEPDEFSDEEDYVRQEEGTYNPLTGFFYCTECYIRIGMPLGTA